MAKSASTLYEKDLYAWTQEQTTLLRSHQWSQLDLPNLIPTVPHDSSWLETADDEVTAGSTQWISQQERQAFVKK
jgi:Domain of unknown function DUF29